MSKKDYLQAVEQLRKWGYAYYVKDEPIASDDEYDKLYDKVKIFENQHPDEVDPKSPTFNVGGVSKSFNRASHKDPMWSQLDIFNIEDATRWITKIRIQYPNTKFVAEFKGDGLSLKLTYKDGKLVRAVTRGDGKIGDDVTNNAMVIDNIPKRLMIDNKLVVGEVDVSGEIIMYKKDFDRLNAKQEKLGMPLYANPRNAAAGTLRSLDSRVVRNRNLHFLAWELSYGGPNIKSEYSRIIWLGNLGFTILDTYKFESPEDFEDIAKDAYFDRPNLAYGIDGLVIKVDDVTLHKQIGYTAKYPKWSIAYKFPAVEKTTKILDIITQVGRLGTVTPVALLEPIEIDGSVVSKVTLHNFRDIEMKDIRIGDEVLLIKSGDIIPKITKVFKDRRTTDIVVYRPPTHCGCCNTQLIREDVFRRCPNESCPCRIKASITHFADRAHMDIHGFGDSVVSDLVDKNFIKTPLDIYKLTKEQLMSLDGFSHKKAENLLHAIEASKGKEEYLVIASIGIPNIGKTVMKQLVDRYPEMLLDLSADLILSIKGMGETIANSYVVNIRNKYKSLIEELLVITQAKKSIKKEGKFKDKKFVITGKMIPNRETVKKYIEDNGGDVRSSVSSDIDYLVVGEKAGSKLAKAKKLNINIIKQEQLNGEKI